MSPEIPWPESRKEWKPVDMTVIYHGNGSFYARMDSGEIEFLMEAPVGMGGGVARGRATAPDSSRL